MPRPIETARGRLAVHGVVAAVLAAAAWWLPDVRRGLIFDITWWDAAPNDATELPTAPGTGLAPTARTRVVLIDGLTAEVAPALRTWSAVCKRGIDVVIDVGFPTISLPVEVALWTGLTQQQTGTVTRNGGRGGSYGHPLEPPLDRRGIPAQIAGSIAIAEDHGWIVRSLGFSRVEPRADPGDATKDANAAAWRNRWQRAAIEAIGSASPLVFVHILRVDTTGHSHGVGAIYLEAAVEADLILDRLVEADPAARWFVLSDHGHIAGGGHGGEERDVRQVRGCIAGPGIVAESGDPARIHVIDVARALADSTGATLDAGSRGRPIAAARSAPLAGDQAVPPIGLGPGVIAIFLVVVGIAASLWGARRRWWLAPWWFVAACASLYVVRGEPTLSTGWIYKPEGREMYVTWLPALALAAASAGLTRTVPLGRVVAAQLGLPAFATAAAMAACGAWSVVFGAEVAPVVPRYTAWMLALVLMVAHGAAAVALGVLARLVLRAFDRRGPSAPRRSARAADA